MRKNTEKMKYSHYLVIQTYVIHPKRESLIIKQK